MIITSLYKYLIELFVILRDIVKRILEKGFGFRCDVGRHYSRAAMGFLISFVVGWLLAVLGAQDGCETAWGYVENIYRRVYPRGVFRKPRAALLPTYLA